MFITRGSLAGLLIRPMLGLTVALFFLSFQQVASASPFGQGNYSALVPYGGQTSITIALSGNVTLSLVPSGGNFTASGNSTVTVTTTDVNGYSLYLYSAGNSSLVNGANTITASSNVSEAPLAVNTWGYNTDGSSNYIGTTTTPVTILNTSGPYETGNPTTVYYSALASGIKAPGNYVGNVTYTVVSPT